MYICRVIGKEAVSASPQGLLKGRLEGLQKRLAGASKMLGRAQEAGRHERLEGARGWKARGSRNWRVAGANMRQKCFSQNKRALGVFTALGVR